MDLNLFKKYISVFDAGSNKTANGVLQKNVLSARFQPAKVSVDRNFTNMRKAVKLLQKQLRVARVDLEINFQPMISK